MLIYSEVRAAFQAIITEDYRKLSCRTNLGLIPPSSPSPACLTSLYMFKRAALCNKLSLCNQIF